MDHRDIFGMKIQQDKDVLRKWKELGPPEQFDVLQAVLIRIGIETSLDEVMAKVSEEVHKRHW